MQFLLEGVRQGEKLLYITLSETVDELHEIAQSHGWDLGAVEVYELLAKSRDESAPGAIATPDPQASARFRHLRDAA